MKVKLRLQMRRFLCSPVQRPINSVRDNINCRKSVAINNPRSEVAYEEPLEPRNTLLPNFLSPHRQWSSHRELQLSPRVANQNSFCKTSYLSKLAINAAWRSLPVGTLTSLKQVGCYPSVWQFREESARDPEGDDCVGSGPMFYPLGEKH